MMDSTSAWDIGKTERERKWKVLLHYGWYAMGCCQPYRAMESPRTHQVRYGLYMHAHKHAYLHTHIQTQTDTHIHTSTCDICTHMECIQTYNMMDILCMYYTTTNMNTHLNIFNFLTFTIILRFDRFSAMTSIDCLNDGFKYQTFLAEATIAWHYCQILSVNYIFFLACMQTELVLYQSIMHASSQHM